MAARGASFSALALLTCFVGGVPWLGGCHSNAPDGRAESQCFDHCKSELASRCNDDQCVRGCRFILDRLVEHEGRRVLACIGRGGGEGTLTSGPSMACDDQAWASCAAKVGIHADGGPPAPPPPEDDGE